MKETLPFRPYSHLLLILLLGALAYANTFQAPFVLDDLTSISTNPVITELANFAPGGPGYDFVPRRWVGYLSFAVNHQFGGLEVGGYHLVNLLIHLGTASLLYALVVLSFRTPELASSRLAPRADTIALLAALLFVAHPVQTQAVTYIVQRLTSLATFFYLAALVLYVAARLAAEQRLARAAVAQEAGRLGKKGRRQRPATEGGGWRVGLLLALAVGAAVLAMYTKEIAFTLPLAALLYEGCFFRGGWLRRLLFLLPLLLTLLILPLSILAGADELGTGVGEQLRAQSEVSRLHYLFSQCRVLVTYLRLLVLPINQNVDYDYPLFTSFLHPQVLGSILLLTLLLLLAGLLHHRSRPGNIPGSEPALRLVSFGIFWFFLTLSVESSVVPILDLIFEHRLYLPLSGVAAAVAVLVVLASEKSRTIYGGRLPLFLAALVVAALGVATWQRNQVWSSNIRLWQDAAEKSPNKHRPWYNLGTVLDEADRPQEALVALSRAVALEPNQPETWHNLGRVYRLLGRTDLAIAAFRKAIEYKPQMDDAAANLALSLISIGQPGEALALLEPRLPRGAGIAETHYALGLAYAMTKQPDKAQQERAMLEQMDPLLALRMQVEIANIR